MTFKEFLKNNPADVEKAKKCNSIEEFEKLVKSVGIDYDTHEQLVEAYNFVKNNKELSENELEAAAGGQMYKHEAGDSYISKDGSVITDGKGKKV